MAIQFSRKDKKAEPGTSYIERNSEILHINCRGCSHFPDGCAPDCISCMCEAVANNGTAEKIRLESGRDVEFSGRAAEMVCNLARIRRPIIQIPTGRKCARCPRNPESIINFAWSEFPDPNFDAASSRLYSDMSDGPECTACMQRTYNAISAAKNEMEKIRKTAEANAKLKGVLL
ncbi:MAG: hypothetical protein MJZ21_04505 [archaeon]|nr:hypothetical protein [archaeon]